MSSTRISVIIPTLNEEESIGETMDQIPRSDDMEIMIVDGLSKDRTREIASKRGARVVEEKRKGYGRAYKTGFKEARGEIIVTMDGDTTYPAELTLELVKRLEKEGVDFLSCDRIKKADKGAFTGTHALGNWILKATMNVLFGMHLNDSQTGMWVFRKKVLKNLTITSDGMPMSEEIKIEVFNNKKVRAKEISVPYRIRVGDKALNTWKDGFRNLMFLFKKRFNKKGLGPGEDF